MRLPAMLLLSILAMDTGSRLRYLLTVLSLKAIWLEEMNRGPWDMSGTFILGVFTMILSINFATTWYKESIKAKTELRQDILNEIAGEGKRIIDEKEIKILKENTEIMQLWMKNNPKKAEDFLRFKEGFEASKKSR